MTGATMNIPYPSTNVLDACAERRSWTDRNERRFEGRDSFDSFFSAAKKGSANIAKSGLVDMFKVSQDASSE